jgi:uncharacterized protein
VNWPPPQIALLTDNRLHLQQGPIDLIIKAEGEASDVQQAYQATIERFNKVLTELTAELAFLRTPLGKSAGQPHSPIARRMVTACQPYAHNFITPMAAVAGSVADEIMAIMLNAAPALATVYVNNGGDIAVHAGAGHSLRVGLVPDLVRAIPEGFVTVTPPSQIGGIATSGWRGRSFSLGIADAVTVLARTAAEADAAATIIANAVDAGDPAILRAPATSLDPDSDLGDRLVTTDVGALPKRLIDHALERGATLAQRLVDQGLIGGAALSLQNNWRLIESRTGLLKRLA